MGSQSSKAAKGDVIAHKPAEAAAVSPSKSNGQENGHVKVNGDVPPKADGEAPPLNGNGSAEPVKDETKVDSSSGDAIEPAPAAEGGEAKPDGAAACKETPKKKKKFSFKKSFKLSGISFRKNKKEAGDSSAGSSPTEEQAKAEAKKEENPTCSTNDTEQANTTQEGKAEEKVAAVESSMASPAGQQDVEPKNEDAEAGEAKEEKEKQLGESQEAATAKPEESSKPVVPEPTTTLAAAEQKEE